MGAQVTPGGSKWREGLEDCGLSKLTSGSACPSLFLSFPFCRPPNRGKRMGHGAGGSHRAQGRMGSGKWTHRPSVGHHKVPEEKMPGPAGMPEREEARAPTSRVLRNLQMQSPR